jgi:hypothetical protein
MITASGFQTVGCDTPTLTKVDASASSQVLIPANSDRVHGSVFNDSTAVLYLAWGPTASTTLYTVQVPPRGYYELPRVVPYVGAVSGLWATANGAARITEAI